MKNNSIWKTFLEVIKNSPSSQKSTYPTSANIVVLGIIFVRCISVAYFVMGIVWKVHTGVIDESWVEVLNRLAIGKLKLGMTVNALALTTVCLFPVYIICGCYGLLGIFCRKKIFIVMYMVSLVIFILADVVLLSLFVVLRDGIEGSLAANFQNIYTQMAQLYRSYSTDVKGIKDDWFDMFSKLGCCGVWSQYSTYSYECSGYIPGQTCWGKFSTIMRTYLTTYACLAGICLITEIVQLVMCDVIYSQMSQTKFPFALPRTCITMLRTSWKRARPALLVNIIRIMACVPAISLIVMGTMLLTDSKMSGVYANGLYTYIYILGQNFTTIVEGLGVLMIVQGSVDFLVNAAAFISDVVLHSKSKSIVITAIKILMVVSKLTSLGFVIKFAVQVNNDLRFNLDNLLRNFDYLRRHWLFLFGELECCGVTSSNDLCTMYDPGYCNHNLPYTCCQHDLYTVSENTIYRSLACSSPNTPCFDVVCAQFQWYTTGYFIGISFSLLLGVLGIIFTVLHVRSLKAEDTSSEIKKRDSESKSEVEQKSIPRKSLYRRVITYIKNNVYLTIYSITSTMLLMCAVGLFVVGFVLTYDKVFNHDIIRDVLWKAITFEGFSFNNIRQSFSYFMISSALGIAVVSGTGLFTLRTRSKYLHIMQIILVSLACSLMIVGVGLGGKAYYTVCHGLNSSMSTFLSTHGYNEDISYLFANVASSAWSNLFAVAECCGISDYAGTELTGTSKQIPIYCCKDNPLTESYVSSNDNCTDFLMTDLQHTKSCKDAIISRLEEYSIPFFVFASLIITSLIIQLIATIVKLRKVTFIPLNDDKFFRRTKTLCKTKKTYKQIITFEKRMIVTITTIISSFSMMVIGIVMKHDEKMTGQYVQYVYHYLYFRGVNLTDIIEAMYLSFIIIGVLSVVMGMLKLSDMLRELQNRTKIKMYIGGLVILILTKLVLVFMMIPIRVDVDDNASYQLTNMDRQYFNGRSLNVLDFGNVLMYRVLNRFYLAFDCCGADGPYALANMKNTGGYSAYSSLSGVQPYACCNGSDYVDSTSTYSSIICEKKSCTPEFLSKFDSYSDAFLATMSLVTFFEIICLIIEVRNIAASRKELSTSVAEHLRRFFMCSRSTTSDHRKKIIFGITLAMLLLLPSVGLLAESIIVRYDATFSHKQIDLLFSSMTMVHLSFSKNLVIWRWLMIASSVIFVTGGLFTAATIQRESKLLHVIAVGLNCFSVCTICGVTGWWIAVHVSGFSTPYQWLWVLGSYLTSAYDESIDGAWNNLFNTLQCCGYSSVFQFAYVNYESTSFNLGAQSLFCCLSNPITKSYNHNTACTKVTEPCLNKLTTKLQDYSIPFYVLMSSSLILVAMLIVLLGILIWYDKPFAADHVIIKLKSIGKQRRKKKKLVDLNESVSATETTEIPEEREQITEQTARSNENWMKNRNNKVEPIASNTDSDKNPDNTTNQPSDSASDIESVINL